LAILYTVIGLTESSAATSLAVIARRIPSIRCGSVQAATCIFSPDVSAGRLRFTIEPLPRYGRKAKLKLSAAFDPEHFQ